MKRSFFALTLVLAMALLLCACGNDNIENSVQEGQQKLTSVESCALVLQIADKPLVELYLD